MDKIVNTYPKNPKISIIIPCYNYGRFITETVESVLAQTLKNFEIIIIDDGSTDQKTLGVLEKLKEMHPEIKIIHQANGGPANARNNGIRISQGEYFLPLDADDMIKPIMLEKCYEEIAKDPKLGMVYTWVHFFGNDDAVWKNSDYNFFDLLHANQATVSALVRKEAWEEVGGYDESMRDGYEDWEFWISLGEKGWFGKLIREPLFNYRKHGTSTNMGAELKHDSIVKYIREKHSVLYSKESLAKIKKTWWSKGKRGLLKNISGKFEGAGLSDSELWKKHPLMAAGRIFPIRLKRKINSFFGKKIFDTNYYHRSGD